MGQCRHAAAKLALVPDEDVAAATIRRVLHAVDDGRLTADTPSERRVVERLRGAALALEQQTKAA